MSITIKALGGYNEFGRNCTAVEIDDQIIILDMGLDVDKFMSYQEEEDSVDVDVGYLKQLEIVPHLEIIDPKKVIAIVLSHGHLDHIGGVQYVEQEYDAPIICTPFTAKVVTLQSRLKNKIISVPLDGKHSITKDITVEFITATHSIPHASFVALHTPYGSVLYANDFKFDPTPTLGSVTNLERLQTLNPKVLINECIYSNTPGTAGSERHAAQMLKEEVIKADQSSEAVIVTTFSSHIARLKTILEIAAKTGREPVFFGRSLRKYGLAAEDFSLISLKGVKLFHGKEAKKMLGKIMHDKKRYLIVATGHQGEPNAMLMRMATHQTPFVFDSKDTVIFSCRIIPAKTSEHNSAILDNHLKEAGVHIIRNIHVSGHAFQDDLKTLCALTEPEHIFPCHADAAAQQTFAKLARQWCDAEVHILKNKESKQIP